MQMFTGLDYLKIDIANNFGLDKLDWNDRLGWFEENEHQLDACLNKADAPALFYAGVQAYRNALKGKPSGYPISLDATSSGIQILACLTGDRRAAELCNVVNTGHREDAYTGLYDLMVSKIGEAAKIDRKQTKQAIMTAFYNSTAMPKKIFGEGKLLDIFYETMAENAPGAWELNETMLAIWDPTKLVNEWVLPDNFHVRVKVMSTTTETVNFLNKPYEVNYTINAPMEKGRSLGANMVHSIDGMLVREMSRRCNYNNQKVNQIFDWLKNGAKGGHSQNRPEDKLIIELMEHYNESGFFSARVLDYIDLDNLGLVNHDALIDLVNDLPEKPFEILAVHDCFRCLPNYGTDLRKQYNYLLSGIAKSNLLSFVLSQMLGRVIPVQKIDDNLYIDILDADYALS